MVYLNIYCRQTGIFYSRYKDGVLVIPKALVKSPISAYENTLEVETVPELEQIISEPDAMRMQALLVRERILGPAHPDTSYYIRYRYSVDSQCCRTVSYNCYLQGCRVR